MFPGSVTSLFSCILRGNVTTFFEICNTGINQDRVVEKDKDDKFYGTT